MDISTATLPEPLPETPTKSSKGYTIPIGIATAAILMVISGTYLYVQGQNLWTKAREPSTKPVALSIQEDIKPVAPPPTLLSTDSIPSEAHVEITDHVQKSAMAPEKTVSQGQDKPTSFSVQIRSKKANLHSGPGTNFPIIGSVLPNERYPVTEWKDRWFKVIVSNSNDPNVNKVAWIRNDLVQVLP